MGMRVLKEIFYTSLVLAGLTRAAAWLNRRKLLVLAYHDVYAGPTDPVDNFDGLRVRVDRFERQIRYLASHYRVVPLARLFDAPAAPRHAKPLAAITFDDGYKNTYRYAYPLLRRLGLPATVFVIPDFSLHGRVPWWERLRTIAAQAGRPDGSAPARNGRRPLRWTTEREREDALLRLSAKLRRLPPEERENALAALAEELGSAGRAHPGSEPLSVDEILEMTDAGISVGSHGLSHDSFLHMSPDRLETELIESKRVLESVTGRPVAWLAYPYGHYSECDMEAALRAGYHGAVTTGVGLNDRTANPFAVRRVSVDDRLSFSHFVVAVTGLRDILKRWLRISVGRRRAVPVPADLPEG